MKRKTNSLHYETVTQVLMNTLLKLMEEPLFDSFVLVGGTNLSLRLGHRISDDIDLFTDAEYGSIHFDELERFMQKAFPYYDKPDKSGITGLGSSYYVGLNEENCVKFDLMYADAPFFEVCEIHDRIRMATQKQIAAMKMEAVNTGGRKKDWWDIHELLKFYSLDEMLRFHERWEEWTHDRDSLLDKLILFDEADNQPNPRCLKGKDWDDIKLDIISEVSKLRIPPTA